MIRSLRDTDSGLYVAVSDEDLRLGAPDEVLVFSAAPGPSDTAASGAAADEAVTFDKEGLSQDQAPTPGGIRAATALPTDPLLASQWHLGNTGGLFDLRVQGVWNLASGAAYTGAGVRAVVIDNGFDYNHQDLAPNYDQGLDYDFADVDLDPFGLSTDSHGTAVAGIIGADNNGTGAVGVAFDVSLVGYRTANLISDFWLQNIRDAIHHAALSAQGDVANISQGIANDAASEFGAGYNAVRFDEIETSIGEAVGQGRGGLGMTIVKSAGNSRSDNYDVNADDWTNDTRQVVVAAVNQDGFVSSYSSYGAALLVSAFGTPGQVVTTDRTGAAGYNATDFTYTFNGTSAAAPMVTGVVSLLYDANPGLGWRDVQSILALTARQVGSEVGSGPAGSERYLWNFNAASTWNGGGLHFSNDYGYGLVDALAAVRLAETWLDATPAQTNGNEFTNTLDMLNATVVIPDGNFTGTSFTGVAGFDDEVDRVTVTITFSTTFLADLELYVISPDGTVSELIDDVAGSADFNGTWTFETQAFRGERAAGTWTVRIVDDAGGDVLSVSDVVLRTYGRFSSDDRYVFTNEYSDYAGAFGHTTTIADTNGGTDAFNAAAVSSNSTINLNAGGASNIDGVALTIAAGTTIENAYGGDGNDTLIGNAVGNRLLGGRGNDSLDGGNGTDSLYGGDGDDTLSQNFGGPNEVMDGGAGSDTGDWSYNVFDNWVIDLTAGTAKIGATAYALLTSIENAIGSQSADTILGTSGGNRLDGQGGNDSLNGGGGTDSLYGGAGDDTLSQNTGGPNEIMDGGADNDTGDWSYNDFGFPWTIDLAAGTATATGTTWAQLVSIENVIGTQNSDIIIGSSGANRLDGQNGNDSIDGGGGTDSLYGGAGDDTLSQNTGGPNEIMDGGADNDTGDWSYNNFGFPWTIDLAAGTAVSGGTTWAQLVSIENVIGTQNSDIIIGSSGANRLDGQNGNDSLDGGGGTDSLYGGAGDDTLSQNTGSTTELMDGGADNDTGDWSYNSFGFPWTIDLAAGTASATGTTYAQLVSIENVIGTQNSDIIIGSSGANRLDGQNGNDSIDGGLGDDSLYGGTGNDTLSQNFSATANAEIMDGGADNDTGDWSYSGSNWTIDLAGGTAKISGTTWAQLFSIENVTGAQGNDTILGDGGANRLDGQAGGDSLLGQAGNDTLVGGTGIDTLDGGNNDDLLLIGGVDAINDVMLGGAGNDRLQVIAGSGPLTLTTLSRISGVETLDGSGEIIQGDGTDNRLDFLALAAVVNVASINGLGGNDTINGGNSGETIDGGLGNDRIYSGGGNDQVLIAGTEALGDTIGGGAGTLDTLQIRAGSGAVTLTTLANFNGFEVFDGNGQSVFGTAGGDLLNFTPFTSVVNLASINAFAGNDTITGSVGDDTIDGGSDNDRIDGRAGNDSILAGSNDDVVLIAGTEALGDTIDGGSGTLDTLQVRGGSGAVTLATLANFTGFEVFDGSGQAVWGTASDDILNFSTFNSVVNLASIIGYQGNDTIIGSSFNNNTIDGRGGNDSMVGGGANDWFLLAGTEALGDTIDGGSGGNDVLQIRAGSGALTLATLAHFTGIEVFNANGQAVWGTSSGDLLDFSTFTSVLNLASIIAYEGNDTVIGSGAADTIEGRVGSDSIDGRGGDDRILAGDNNDVVVFAGIEALGDTIDGGSGTLDTLQIRAGSGTATLATLANFTGLEVFDGNGQAVQGTSNDDFLNFSTFTSVVNLASIIGNLGNDTVIGSGGADTIDGRGGNDSMVGGNGDDWFLIGSTEAVGDTITGGIGTDHLQVRAGSGLLTLSTTQNFSQIEIFDGAGSVVQGTSGGDFLNFSIFSSVTNVVGINTYQGNDTIVGSAGADTINGGAGNDSIVGGGGSDSLTGGADADQFVFASSAQGTDVITDFAVAVDKLVISAAGFGGGLFAGADLAALGRFVSNTTGFATAAFGQFINETDVGRLWWDVDGTGGTARVAVADLLGVAGQTLSASDFTIIA